jgi:hypothetical protein
LAEASAASPLQGTRGQTRRESLGNPVLALVLSPALEHRPPALCQKRGRARGAAAGWSQIGLVKDLAEASAASPLQGTRGQTRRKSLGNPVLALVLSPALEHRPPALCQKRGRARGAAAGWSHMNRRETMVRLVPDRPCPRLGRSIGRQSFAGNSGSNPAEIPWEPGVGSCPLPGSGASAACPLPEAGVSTGRGSRLVPYR